MQLHIRLLAGAATFALAITPLTTLANDNVTVGGSSNPSAAIKAAARAFHEQNPAIDVAVHPTSSGNGVAELRAGSIDVAMVDTVVNDPAFVDHAVGTVGVAILAGPHVGLTASRGPK